MSVATAIATGMDGDDIAGELDQLGRRARAAVRELSLASADTKNTALRVAAATLRARTADLLAANALDMSAAEERRIAPSLLDRLKLDEARINAIAAGLEQIAEHVHPVVDRLLKQRGRTNA